MRATNSSGKVANLARTSVCLCEETRREERGETIALAPSLSSV